MEAEEYAEKNARFWYLLNQVFMLEKKHRKAELELKPLFFELMGIHDE